MNHPLARVIRETAPFLLVGDSDSDRFPAVSYHCYMQGDRPFFCLDLGGLSESRGFTKGGPVMRSLDELPEDWGGDLAIVWVHPFRAAEVVRMVAGVGCSRVWFSFQTVSDEAVQTARQLGVEVVEAGRCPVFYMAEQAAWPCKVHTLVARLSGTRALPPQTDARAGRRELY